MKMLLKLLMIAALSLAPLSNVNAAGWLPLAKSGAVAYQGPGDLSISATITAWWGIRAYSAALRGTKVARVCDLTGGTVGTCADFNSDATTGIIETKAVGGVTCPSASGTNCGVTTLYDRTGVLACSAAACDATQTTAANMPLLASSCIGSGSLPCMTFNGSQTFTTGPNFPTTTLPRTISAVVHRTGSFTSLLTYYNGQTNMEISFASSVDTAVIYNGAVLSATASDAAFHAIQSTVNGASSEIYVDGSATSGSAGTSGAAELAFTTIGGGAFGNAIFNGTEFGSWTAFSSGDKSSLNSNQHTVWGF